MADARTKVKHLVVDSGAFLKNSPLQELAENVYSTAEVIGEIKSKWALDRLQVLPYQVEVRQPDEEDVRFVIAFAKRTGDFFNLSATDLNVIALAVSLERRQCGGSIAHLNQQPKRTTVISNQPSKENRDERDKFGFNFRSRQQHANKAGGARASAETPAETGVQVSAEDADWQAIKPDSLKRRPAVVRPAAKEQRTAKPEEVAEEGEESADEADAEHDAPVAFEEEHSEEEEHSDEEEHSGEDDLDEESAADEEEQDELELGDGGHEEECEEPAETSQSDDDGDWISPGNIAQVKRQFESLQLSETVVPARTSVACITGDFAMQNVLMQIGLKVVSIEKGLIITRCRQFVLRCIACFKITNNTGKMFCPSCGNLKTLKKVSVSVDANGQKRIHLNPKRPVTTRDVKLCIPRPRKGRHALNPILAPDQHVPKFKPSKLAVEEKKSIAQSILTEVDYLVRDNPFSVNDIYSKASQYKTGSRAAAINKSIFNEGRKHANKRKDKRRN